MKRNVWRKLAPFYPLMRNNPISALFLKQETAKIRSLLKPVVHQISGLVVDLGSGRGHSLIFLPDHAEKKIAIDNCPSMIIRTQVHFPAVQFIAADACALPLQPDSIDFISCIGLLEYIIDPSAILSQINTVLKGGSYFLLTSSPPGMLTRLRALSGPRLFPRHSAEVERLLEIHNFKLNNKTETGLQQQYLAQKPF